MRQKIIVTADDYGLCQSVNQAIEECLAAGTVRATCVMANMPVHGTAASLRQKFPRSSVGIHWNITQGKPVLDAGQVLTLVNGDGSFLKPSQLRRRWWSGQLKLSELQAELKAQFERLTGVMGPLDFWNTHQNSHVFPGLFGVFARLGRELGIPAMRCHRRITVPRNTSELRYHLGHPQYWLKGQVIDWWSSRAETLGTLMPDARLYAPGYVETKVMIDEVMTRLPWGKIKTAIELPIHPATKVHSDLFGSLTESRIAEYRVFNNPCLTEHLRQHGIEPVGFEALRPAIKP